MDNLIRLAHLNEDTVVESLVKRYSDRIIYTWTGCVLMALNPFSWIQCPPGRPHPSDVAQNARRGLIESDQTVLISGESGSGKTETAKIVMRCLAGESSADRAILASNPVFEAFGNARTVRNHNSSRFGKFIRMFFDENRERLVGVRIDTYLLEKTRVICRSEREGNFHIFEQLSAGLKDGAALKDLFDPVAPFIRSGGDNLSDQTLDTTLRGMLDTGFSAEDIVLVLRCVASISHILADDRVNICELLQINEGELSSVIDFKRLEVFGETFREERECTRGMRESLAMHVYKSLFDWIVDRINTVCGSEGGAETSSIRVLDIYGFEVLERNSFEQLCINYTNECLQNQCNDHIFCREAQEYASEGILWEEIEYRNNLDRIRVIERTIFPIIEEQCLVSGSDRVISRKLCDSFASSSADRAGCRFTFRHYAGEVVYHVDGFREKNTDERSATFSELFQMHAILGGAVVEEAKKNKRTICSQYGRQLTGLISEIDASVPHYIRCVKPNDTESPLVLIEDRVREQLRYAGVVESIQASRQRHPVRYTHEEFQKKFAPVLNSSFTLYEDDYDVGETRTFIRSKGYGRLMEALNLIRKNAAVMIQRVHRGRVIRGALRILREWVLLSEFRFYREKSARVIQVSWGLRTTRVRNGSSVRIQTRFRGFSARKRYGLCRRGIVFFQKRARLRRFSRFASIIQSHFRIVYHERRRKQRFKEADIIQTFFRTISAKQKSRSSSAAIIQSAARRYLARREYFQRRRFSDEIKKLKDRAIQLEEVARASREIDTQVNTQLVIKMGKIMEEKEDMSDKIRELQIREERLRKELEIINRKKRWLNWIGF
jgi:myosin-5